MAHIVEKVQRLNEHNRRHYRFAFPSWKIKHVYEAMDLSEICHETLEQIQWKNELQADKLVANSCILCTDTRRNKLKFLETALSCYEF